MPMTYEQPEVLTLGTAAELVLGGDGPNAECCTCGKHILEAAPLDDEK